MKEIYNRPFKEVIKEYPKLDDILKRYDLECSTCQFANNFTLEELIADKTDVIEKIKIDIFRLVNNEEE
jgi:hypothetical protein